MLRWSETPDQVFQAIVHDCLESTQDLIGVYDAGEKPTEEEREARATEYRDAFPRLAQYFPIEGRSEGEP